MSSKAKEFYNALKSKPIDENRLINILSSLNLEERLQLREHYKGEFGCPIQDDINDCLSSDFKDLALALFDSPYEFDAREMHRSLHSFMNDDRTICEIMGSRPKEHLDLVNQAYAKFYGVSLKDDIRSETRKEYGDFLNAIIETPRPTGSQLSEERARTTAQNLKNTGLKNLSKDVFLFKETFLNKSREDIVNLARAYGELEGKNFYDILNDELDGKNKKLIKNLFFYLTSPSEYFGRKLFKAIRGLGTDINSLTRVMVTRNEIDMPEIAKYYQYYREKDLTEDILSEDSGNYGKVLANLSQRQ